MHNLSKHLRLLLVGGLAVQSITTQAVAAAEKPSKTSAAAAAQTGSTSPDRSPARLSGDALHRELERQRQIAENARYQVERLRAEMALKDELLELARKRNGELYATGVEILNRYADVDIGDVFSAREPFVQKGRVKLENLVQDYEDALRAARFTEQTLPPSVERRMREELGAAPGAAQDSDASAADSSASHNANDTRPQ